MLCASLMALFMTTGSQAQESGAARRSEAMRLFTLAQEHQLRFEHAAAVDLFLLGIKAAEDIDHRSFGTRKMHAVGSIHALMGETVEAPSFLLEVLHQDSLAHDSVLLVYDHLGLADLHMSAGERVDAIASCRAAMDVAVELGDPRLIGLAHLHWGEASRRAGETKKAAVQFEQALDLFTREELPREGIATGDLLASCYLALDRYQDAMNIAQRMIDLSRSIGVTAQLPSLLRSLAQAEQGEGEEALAAGHYREAFALNDSLDNGANDSALALRYARYRARTKDEALQRSVNMMRGSQEKAASQRTQKLVYLAIAVLLGVLALVLVNRYRSKRRAAEELARINAEVLRQKERAEESERAKDRFLANMSHEMRTPLNAMLGFSDLLLREAKDERSRSFLDGIKRSGDHLLALINDVLDVSRMRAGRLALAHAPFDLHRCVLACEGILQHRADEQRDSFTVDIAPDTPRWVMGDEGRVVQILLNLLGNALKFTTAGDVRLHVTMADDRVRFAVADTGIGIADDKLDSLFQRFTQVDVHDQRKYAGAGLGLAIVKELVDLHGGTIEVESEPGVGSEFIVELPLVSCAAPGLPAAGNEPPAAAPGDLNGRVILVAEDNEMNAVVIAESLRHLYPLAKVEVVTEGQAAVDRMVSDAYRRIAVVLMDLQMPGMDGISATRAIRDLSVPGALVPIIALTANAVGDVRARCLSAGMNDLVTKPFTAASITEAIARCTGAAYVNGRGVPIDHEAYKQLFHKLMPERLQALCDAHVVGDLVAVQRITHTISPQLEQHDRGRFEPLCAAVLEGAHRGDRDAHINALIAAITAELA